MTRRCTQRWRLSAKAAHARTWSLLPRPRLKRLESWPCSMLGDAPLLPRLPGCTPCTRFRYSRYFCEAGTHGFQAATHSFQASRTAAHVASASERRTRPPYVGHTVQHWWRKAQFVWRDPDGLCGRASEVAPIGLAAVAGGGHLQVAGHVFSRQALHVHEVQDPLWHRLCGSQMVFGLLLATVSRAKKLYMAVMLIPRRFAAHADSRHDMQASTPSSSQLHRLALVRQMFRHVYLCL